MKYKIILLLFLTSCINTTFTTKTNFTYSAKGFAYIENKFFDGLENNFFVSHNKLKPGTKIRITNPSNQESIEIIIQKKIEFDNFYKVLISREISNFLKLNSNFPYVEITEIKKTNHLSPKKQLLKILKKKLQIRHQSKLST